MSSHHDLLEIVPALIAYIDASGTYRSMSRAYENWCGIPRDRLLDRHVSEVAPLCFGEEYAREALPRLQRAMAGDTIRFENGQIFGDHRRRVAVSYTPDHAPDGSVRGVLVMVTDITDLHQARSRAALSEERLQLATEFNNTGIWERDLATGRLHWNRACFRVLGFDESHTAPRLEEVYEHMHPEDRLMHRAALEQAVKTRHPFHIEFRMCARNGEWRWIHSRGRFEFDDHGRPVRVLGVSFDFTQEKRASEELARQKRLMESILESTTDGVMMLDREWRFTYLNSRAQASLQTAGWLLGRNLWEASPPTATSQFGACCIRTMNERVATHLEEYYSEPFGCWFEMHIYPSDTGIVVFMRDVTASQQRREALRLREQAIAAAPVGITIAEYNATSDYPLVYVNPAFERLTGYSSAEILGRNCRFLQGPGTSSTVRKRIREAIASGAGGRFVLHNYRKDGTEFFNELQLSPVRNEEGSITHMVGIQTDITERVETRRRLVRQAETDSLTGLANRSAFREALRHHLRQPNHLGTHPLAIIYLDLDGLKHANEQLGHQGGDRLLKKIATRLRSAVPESDLVARLGGDEFAIIASGFATRKLLERLVTRVLARIAAPLQVNGRDLVITASAGYACAPEDASGAEELLRKADLAMFVAKRESKNGWKAYAPAMELSNQNFLEIASGLRLALKHNQFRLVYQPRIEARTGGLRAMEALIRWQHPERGLLSPAAFIPVAEETGLIVAIGDWVVQEVARQLAAWRDAGYQLVPVSLNVSAAQFRNPGFSDTVAATLRETGIPGDLLEVEITESVILDEALSSESLASLRELGIRVAIDDFGSAYSGLSYLQRFAVDVLKIDRGFICRIHESPTAATICQSILQLAQRLGLATVAEGVELAEQARMLTEWGCDELQGYHFGRPVSPEMLLERMTKCEGELK